MPDEPRPHGRYTLIVNGTRKHWDEEKISYSQVVDLAFPPPHGPDELFTVQYSRGPSDNPQGTLAEGQSVSVKNDMVFDVGRTNRS